MPLREQAFGAIADEVFVFRVDGEQGTCFSGRAKRAHEVAHARLEPVHHENLETADPVSDDARNLRNRLGGRVQYRDVKPVVDDRAALRLCMPLGGGVGERTVLGLKCVIDYRGDSARTGSNRP